jgi:ATP-dependent helicase/nuclease subunit B
MQARFLLGPAGSGKTFRCLAEIRAALRENPAGPPLILLAPKQATFQLERQLLADESLPGYARLQIFSFERLAQFVLDQLGVTPPRFLSDEGGVMVLRALLLRHANELKLFRGSARRPGFAQELGRLLNELQQNQVTAAKLRALARRPALRRELHDKLHDLALLLDSYAEWLTRHDLQDGNHLLEAATTALSQPRIQDDQPWIQHLSLDGFAEMTPQELDLLAAVVPLCGRATLAFCLDESAAQAVETSWLSIWSAVGKSFQQCRQRLAALPDCDLQIESLKRNPAKSRFAASAALQVLEQGWQCSAGGPPAKPGADGTPAPHSIRLIDCQDAGAEANFAAREILKFVRHGGHRFRDCAVLVRNLDTHHKPLQRALHRYGIPFFLDRRESVAHHPLAELTRSALRTVAFDWRHEDWFAALKAGFAPVAEPEIDRLENESLARGWRGGKWLQPVKISENAELEKSLERLRQKIIPPFERLAGELARLKNSPNGFQLAGAVREFWAGLKVGATLEHWSLDQENAAARAAQSAIHQTVWTQMNAWLDNLALAFAHEPLPLRDWLPVLEAGLANLTIGVVPPALDQVLVGAIDRARNPDLKLAFVLGVNETLFPAAPATPAILTDADRDELTIPLGPNLRERLARERYYGYIACTRASERLVVTFARQDAEGKTLNPSPFIAHLQNIFPTLEVEEFSGDPDWREAEHASELVQPLVEIQMPAGAERTELKSKNRVVLHPSAAGNEAWRELLSLPALQSLAGCLAALREPDENESLSPALAEKLYSRALRSSVSRLEEFAQCPFRFFIRSGLHADERKVFELDARERGTFQHEVLKRFHESLVTEGKRWRDLSPEAARERIAAIAGQLAHSSDYRDGLLRDTAQTQFEARALTSALQDFVEVAVAWMHGQYAFDPAAVELGFGGSNAPVPAWEIALDGGHQLALHGRIDRVDLWRGPNSDEALAVVLDYKSSKKTLDPVLIGHGVQLQLLGYLAALRHWPDPQGFFQVKRLIPAGVFYVNLRGEPQSGGTRDEILAEGGEARRQAYRHTGRFDAGALEHLDRTGAADQFNYRRNKDGSLRKGSVEALSRDDFKKLLDGVEEQLRSLGERIFDGEAKVSPYRKGNQTPCEYCDYQSACRIDKWTHPYRVLRAEGSLRAF